MDICVCVYVCENVTNKEYNEQCITIDKLVWLTGASFSNIG